MPSADADHDRSLLAQLLGTTAGVCARHALVTLVLVAVSVVLCVAGSWKFLNFKTDRSDLIDPQAEFHQRWLKYTESFGDASDIVIVVEAPRTDQIRKAMDDLAARLANEPEHFRNILYKVDASALKSKGLQYLSPDQLRVGLDRLEQYRSTLEGQWEKVRLQQLLPRLHSQLASTSRARTVAQTDFSLAHLTRLTESLSRFARDRNDFANPWPDMISLDERIQQQASQAVYVTNEDGTLGFMRVAPGVSKSGQTFGSLATIRRCREIVAELSHGRRDLKIELTGIPVLEADEMERSQVDMTWASIISYAICSALLILGLRGILHPAMAMVMLAISVAWTFGYLTGVVGHLNILSVAFVSILIGLGIDFAIHYLSHYLSLRREGLNSHDAITQTATTIGPGMVVGAITTAMAFLCSALTPFLGVAELGLIAGGGVMLAVIAAMTVLPAMLAWLDGSRTIRDLPHPFEMSWLRSLTSRLPGLATFAGLAIAAVCIAPQFRWNNGKPTFNVQYDHNLLNLQARGVASVDAQFHIFEKSKSSLLFAVAVADSPEQARRLKAKFEKLPTVHHVEDLASRLPAAPVQQTKLLIQSYNAQLQRLPKAPAPPRSPTSPVAIGRALEELHQHLLRRGEPQAKQVARRIDVFLDDLQTWSSAEQTQFLTEFDYRLAYALLAQFQGLCAASNTEPVILTDFPEEVRSRFVSSDKKWLLQVYPNEQVWDMAPLTRFVKDLRTVDPEVTGTPLQNYEAALQLKASYEQAGVYALLVVVMVLLVDYVGKDRILLVVGLPLLTVGLAFLVFRARRVDMSLALMATAFTMMSVALTLIVDARAAVYTLLSIAPPALGLLMTFGLMCLLNVPLNPANLIILPLLLGIGVDNGVHVVHDFLRTRERPFAMSSSTINAIVLCSLTTMAGFGSMMIAAHRGLFSLGLVLTLGVGSSLFVALVILPSVIAWWTAPVVGRSAAQDDSSRTRTASPQKAAKVA